MVFKKFDPLKKYAQTDNHQEAKRPRIPVHIVSIKGQKKHNKIAKFFTREAKANKAPVERGETVPRGRIHHCPCGKAMNAVCVRKGHLIECSYHSGNYSIPGNLCAECENEADAKGRRYDDAVTAERKRMEEEDKDKWYRDVTNERKPSTKFADQTMVPAHDGPL
ncbi:MAG: hypothetical protein LQ341_004595 [Variospora aurantia]|nr:MAG: hypothetical protein LQ341_004595 [Variospora aurantia]